MVHVVDFEKTAFSTPFRGVLAPSGPQISAESGSGHPLSGTRETWLIPLVHLITILPSLATTSYDLPPLATAIHRPPNWQRPNGARSRRAAPLYSVCHRTRRFFRTNQSVFPTRLRPIVNDA